MLINVVANKERYFGFMKMRDISLRF